LKKIFGIGKGDWKAIAYCVFAAITFWFINTMNINYSIDVTHPLVIHYDEEAYSPIGELPKEIRFSTTASGWDIFTKTNFINSSPIDLDIDDFKKRRYITGSRLKNIVAKQMDGIQINEILDDTIYVNLEKLKTQKIKLVVDSKKIELSEGYMLIGAVSVEPSEITVSGPTSKVKQLSPTVVLPIEEKELSGKYSEKIALIPLFKKDLHLSEEFVNVTFESIQLEKGSKGLKLTKVNFPKKKGVKLSASEVKLVYYGRESDMADLENTTLEAQVDFLKLNEKNKTIKVVLKNVPSRMQKYQFEPSVIKISYAE
jgi:hypothetical protein